MTQANVDNVDSVTPKNAIVRRLSASNLRLLSASICLYAVDLDEPSIWLKCFYDSNFSEKFYESIIDQNNA